MAQTRTWLTTPVGEVPLDDEAPTERWVPGPAVPTEPRPPARFRGAMLLAVTLLAVVGLTFLVAPMFLDTQDPTFGGEGTGRLDDDGSDTAFDRPTAN